MNLNTRLDKLDAHLYKRFSEKRLGQERLTVMVRCSLGASKTVADILPALGGTVERDMPSLDALVVWIEGSRLLELAGLHWVVALGEEDHYKAELGRPVVVKG